MTSYKRCGNRWTVNECLQLQREFELLGLSIDEIATRHQRSPNAIMFKIDMEGFADYNMLYSSYIEQSIHMNESLTSDSDTNSISEVSNSELRQKMLSLENQINTLTQVIMKQTKSKNILSLLA
jgi:uncharacterized protein with NRDE domain